MKSIDKKDIVRAVNGRNLDVAYNPTICGVVTDSRKVEPGFLYVAIPGERVDGHDFIDEALAKGAVLVFSERTDDMRPEVIRVENTVKALGQLAEYYLTLFELPKIAVTGSCGKTTTKDMIYYVLREGFRIHRSEGNHNNEIGLPLSVMELPEEAEAAIFEMGMYTLGEIDHLAHIVRPNIAVITNIGTCHIEHLKTRENIFKAKMEISGYLTPEDVLIVNGEDEYLGTLRAAEKGFRLIRYGMGSDCDVSAEDVCIQEGKTFFRLRLREGIFEQDSKTVFELPAIGDHHVGNALAAITCGLVLGLSQEVMARGLRKFRPSAMRMDIVEKNGITFINDAYNASPESMKAVIESMTLYGDGRKVAVLGDMLELGTVSEEKHREIGRIAAKHFEIVLLIGPQMRYAYEVARAEGMQMDKLFHFEENTSATRELERLLQAGDRVLFKGSRGMHIDEIADALTDPR